MNFLVTEVLLLLRNKSSRRNLLIIFWFLLALFTLIFVYTIAFHFLMEREGKEYSLITGLYWTLTVMTTLGFGDITFHSDLGRLFSICVLMSGVFSLLVILPFIFIEFFYEPWMRAHTAARVPRGLSEEYKNHIILTHYDIVTKALINRLNQYKYPYILIVEDLTFALNLYDEGVNVMLGDLNDPETYKKARVNRAVLVASTCRTSSNVAVCFAVRTLNNMVPIITTSEDTSSREVLKLAGSTRTLLLDDMMGQILARRTNGGDAMSHLVGDFDSVRIAEATPASVMIGKKIRELGLREKVGVTVLGVWERGKYKIPGPETLIKEGTILLLAGTAEQLKNYDVLFCIYNVAMGPVVIIGSERVGQATAAALKSRDLDYRIIERDPAKVVDPEKTIIGEATDIDVLKKAGVMEAPAVVITSKNSDVNLYLTILIRHLQSELQIVSRAGTEGNVTAMHEAGTDFVMSYAAMGANTIMNYLKKGDILMVAEGLDLFKVKVPSSLVNKTIQESNIKEMSGCNVVVINNNGSSIVLPKANERIPEDSEIILIGNEESETRFLEMFGKFK